MDNLPVIANLWILGEDGRTPVQAPDVLAWGECMEDYRKRQVAYDVNPETGMGASTVFYGMARFGGDVNKPMFFETMVFDRNSPTFIRLSQTWEEAEQTHIALCAVYGIPVGVTEHNQGVPNV